MASAHSRPPAWHQIQVVAIGNLRIFKLRDHWYRSYDPTIGRHTQPDPVGFVDGPSVYGYSGGNPSMRVDPDGRIIKEIITGGRIGAVAGAMTPIPGGAAAGAALGATAGAAIYIFFSVRHNNYKAVLFCRRRQTSIALPENVATPRKRLIKKEILFVITNASTWMAPMARTKATSKIRKTCRAPINS